MTVDFWKISLGRYGEFRKSVLRVFAIFQVPRAQYNQYVKVACFGVLCPELPQSHFGEPYSATLEAAVAESLTPASSVLASRC